MGVLKIRGMRANLLLVTQGRRRGLMLHKGFRDMVVAIKDKARVNHPKMGDTSGLLGSQGKGHVSIATSPNT